MNEVSLWIYLVVFLAIIGLGALVIEGVKTVCSFFVWLTSVLDGDDE